MNEKTKQGIATILMMVAMGMSRHSGRTDDLGLYIVAWGFLGGGYLLLLAERK